MKQNPLNMMPNNEQDCLESHPVVQEDAERPGCTTRTRFFF